MSKLCLMNERHYNAICVHAGTLEDPLYGGATAPIYTSTTYDYRSEGTNLYPRYFNTPNQVALAQKMAALENTDAALIFASGMAAISAVFMAFLKSGDHIILQRSIYGGTYHFIVTEFDRCGITYSFVDHMTTSSLEAALTVNTKMIYIETPSNPLLEVTDISVVSAFAKANSLISTIDNTFASPINQNPADYGIDLILHSATKYLGGHSDITAGVVCGAQSHIDKLWKTAKNYGGSLSDHTVWLLERSIKTLALRVKQQNASACAIAHHLEEQPFIDKVFYPGLKSHPGHEIASNQMRDYGGMLSFELSKGIQPEHFLENLKLIKPALSLAGVESIILAPVHTSHSLLTAAEREAQGISDRLLRLSVGIEEVALIINDIEQAAHKK